MPNSMTKKIEGFRTKDINSNIKDMSYWIFRLIKFFISQIHFQQVATTFILRDILLLKLSHFLYSSIEVKNFNLPNIGI